MEDKDFGVGEISVDIAPVAVDVDEKSVRMGYELDWGVEKAMVIATMAEDFDVTPALQSPADA